ncbi:MAG: hypothetical protein U9R49_02580, partial [Bacteroidota bacterium]|nr:hypothetical protein [Bacteroidota bacterium]
AISSLVSQAFYAIAQMILSVRLLKIPSNRDIFIKLAVFLAINMVSGYLTLLIPGWIPGLLLLAVSCIASALLLGLIRPSEIRSVLVK